MSEMFSVSRAILHVLFNTVQNAHTVFYRKLPSKRPVLPIRNCTSQCSSALQPEVVYFMLRPTAARVENIKGGTLFVGELKRPTFHFNTGACAVSVT